MDCISVFHHIDHEPRAQTNALDEIQIGILESVIKNLTEEIGRVRHIKSERHRLIACSEGVRVRQNRIVKIQTGK